MITLRDKRVFIASPRPGVGVDAYTIYTRPAGAEMCCYAIQHSRSDTADVVERRWSDDHGHSWSAPEPVVHRWEAPAGVVRGWAGPIHYADPATGLLHQFYNQALLPGDHAGNWVRNSHVRWRASADGVRGALWDEPLVCTGSEFDEAHPMPGVWRERNGVMFGDVTCLPILCRGRLLLPVQIAPLDETGQMINPYGTGSFHHGAVLIGAPQAGGRFAWHLSGHAVADPERTTRGLAEPTVAEAPDGRLLMLTRGSNVGRPELPGYRWRSISNDGGETWSTPEPWTWDDGTLLFSPCSNSQLLPHPDGNIYWLGNIRPTNPDGSLPRRPLVVAEVEPSSLTLRRATLVAIDDRGPSDHEKVMFSNFQSHVDRETQEIVVHCERFSATGAWEGDAYEYRLSV
jgi:hypothetical protein